ncbi:O-methyltransferase [Collybia nuda]|uniref:O-methyltransferase n=1 Tax=Collybia nuda TaxID=64659 RepID=A0A9P6CDX9_9AGAR|nr:O-methyltransferase [Collybia nuda]
MASEILQLSQLISNSVTELVKLASTRNFQIPSLDEKFTPSSEAFRKDPDLARSAKVIAAAAFQLAASVLPPTESIIQTISGHFKSAALRTSIDCHVAEILRDAGPEGMHIDTIARKTGVHNSKLARLLRLLANRHIFREVRPDYFVNNRISGLLDTGKSVDEILKNPKEKHEGTTGFVSIAQHILSDGHKGSSYISENMMDPVTGFSGEPNHAPFQRGRRTGKSYFDWYTEPEQDYERHRFGIAMRGTTAMIPPNLVLELFDWSTLPANSLVVDVGGGIGFSCRTILGAHPQLRCVVQDIPRIVEDGTKHWQRENPEALASGRMSFQAHDFFTPQPITDASVFFMKSIVHDWSEPYITKILTHLRAAARPDTKLVVCDVVMTYSCREPSQSTTGDIVVAEDPVLVAPELLKTGFNSVNDMVWTLDAAMLVFHNTQEHTLPQMNQLFTKCGWKIVKVVKKGSSLDGVHAVPI